MNDESIFAAAIAIPDSTARAAFLDDACAGHPDLRRDLEALLAAHDKAGSFLSAPSDMRTTDPSPAAEQADTVIAGRYKLLEPIGEGGMGTVWMAQQQEPVKRLVAIKLIKPGMDSKQVLARFDAERQALALMDHPNIAKVFDGGMTSEPDAQARDPHARASGSARPYFVMELVKGIPITKYCDEHHLTPRQRLELFVPVCHAVQHAHQKGIIHRDLKPSNVLVAHYDGRPVPKVIDFGIAKAAGQSLTDKTLVTGFGAIIGTPEYMSPEQAEINQLDIDTRSDIYSLGVLLYELLAGSPPFSKKELEKAGMLEMLRVIREQEPSKPSTKLSSSDALPTLSANRGTEPAKLTKLVRGELDWIVMKALEKDRSRRYETANGFAMDVQRYLADEEVQACPPSAGYRLRKFARRNRRTLTTASLILFSLCLLGVVGWVLVDLSNRRDATGKQVEQAIARAEDLSTQGKLTEAILSAQQGQAILQSGGGSDNLRQRVRQLLSDLDMAGRLEEARLGVGHHVHFDHARTMRAYVAAFHELGIAVESLEPADAADRIRTRSIQGYLMLALDHWASLPVVDPAVKVRLIAIVSEIDADAWRGQVRAAWTDVTALKRLATSAEALAQPPASLCLLGSHLQNQGAPEAAVTLLLEAQRLHAGDFWVNHDLAYHLMACRPSRWDQAVRFLSAAVALRPHSPAAHVKLGWALDRWAQGLGRPPDEAVAMYRTAIRLDPDYANARFVLGNLMLSTGDYEGARDQFSRALEMNPKSADFLLHRAGAYNGLRRWAEALADCDEVIRLEPGRATARFARAQTYRGLGQSEKAIDDYSEAVRLKPDYVLAWNRRGQLYMELKEYPKAVSDFSRASALAPKDPMIRSLLQKAEALMKGVDGKLPAAKEE